jgi:DnaJ-class molecular chaperone
MANKDYYKVLGVSEGAAPDEIKRAYRSLALKYHPDRARGDKKQAEEKFKEVSEAYYVLSDEKRRQQYDAFRQGYGAYAGEDFARAQGFNFDEILKAFTGSGRGSRRSSFGDSDFDGIFDIFRHMRSGGATYTYVYNGNDAPGGYARAHARTDTDIHATLQVPAAVAQRGGEAVFSYKGKKITLRIKPGTQNGQKLRIRGQGQICPHCRHSGDLILTIKLK